MTIAQTLEPDYFFGPGDTLQEWLDENSMSQAELALRLNLSTKALNQIIKVGAPLSQETALKLETVTKVPAQFWNAKEAIFQERKLRLLEQNIARENLKLLKEIPVGELRKRGVITAALRDQYAIYSQVIGFFQVADAKAWFATWGNHSLAFRKSKVHATKVGPLASWLRLGEIEAAKQEVGSFNATLLRQELPKIKALIGERNPNVFLGQIREILNQAGVRFVVIPEIPGTSCSGVTRWVSGIPTIQLSLRHKTDDQLWFTIFHEIGHVLDPAKKSMDISTRDKIVVVDERVKEREAEADKFAAEMLIPSRFERFLHGVTNSQEITKFAEVHGVTPGIVVGRMQYINLIDYSKFNTLKVRYKFNSN